MDPAEFEDAVPPYRTLEDRAQTGVATIAGVDIGCEIEEGMLGSNDVGASGKSAEAIARNHGQPTGAKYAAASPLCLRIPATWVIVTLVSTRVVRSGHGQCHGVGGSPAGSLHHSHPHDKIA